MKEIMKKKRGIGIVITIMAWDDNTGTVLLS